MNRIFQIFALVLLALGCLGTPAQALNFPQVSSPVAILADLNAADAKLTTEFGQKIDLNNTNIREFRDLKGFYPNLAGTIIKNAPYESVQEVLRIAGLSDRQKGLLQANLDKFTVTDPSVELTEGDDRFNPGVY
jgi:photosystem II PsbU protein